MIRGRGLTLIEVLAVVVVLSLAATITMAGLASAGNEAAIRSTIANVQQLDAQARLRARAGTPCVMTVENEIAPVLLDAHDQRCVLAEGGTRPGISVALEGPAIDRTVRFDNLGRSEDYTLEVRHRDKAWRFRVLGLTGWIEPEDQR